MSLKTEVQILGDASSLERATRRASGDLDKFGKKSKTFASKMKGFGAGLIGGAIGAGLVNLGQDLFSFAQSSVQAAIDDNKAQGILANTLKNTVRNGEKQVTGVESQISAWETLYGVLDDNIRPAYGILLKSTHSVGKSNELMQIALDGSAESGKPLAVVAQALGKAFNGSNTSLLKLNTSLKGSKNPIKAYADSVKGAAEKAKKADPFATWQVTLANIQENVGNAILPKLQEFANYLGTPEGQAGIKAWSDFLTSNIALATDLISAMSGNIDASFSKFFQIFAANFWSGVDVVTSGPTGLGIIPKNWKTPAFTQPGPRAQAIGGPSASSPITVNVYNNGKNIDGNDVAIAVKKHLRLYGKSPI